MLEFPRGAPSHLFGKSHSGRRKKGVKGFEGKEEMDQRLKENGMWDKKKVEEKEKKSRRRVGRYPEVLKRVYGRSVRTLLESIAFLLPLSKKREECRCRGRGCLGCVDHPTLFLVREGDNPEYKKLLTKGFAVLPEDAAPLAEFFPDNLRTQIQVVRNTIEMMAVNVARKGSNVMCSGYEKYTQCSNVVDVLSLLPWSTLLSRIGDVMMFHLLSCASIFLHTARNDYLQVTGTPINEVLWFSKLLRSDVSGLPSRIPHQPLLYCPTQHGEAANSKKQGLYLNSVKTTKCQQLNDSFSSEHFEVTASRQKKRKRQFSWQRRRKQRRRSGFGDEHVQITVPAANKDDCISAAMDVREFSKALPYGKRKFDSCSMRCITQQPNGNKLISRPQMFYDSKLHHSVLPAEHMLLRLKPNYHCSFDLINHVFCISDFNRPTLFPSFLEDGNSRFTFSNLSHTVLGLFKTLIRNAKRCQFVRLLERHCPIHPVISSQYQSHKHVLKESVIGFPSRNSAFTMTNGMQKKSSGKEETYSQKTIKFHEADEMNRSSRKEETSLVEAIKFDEACEMNRSFSKHKEVVAFVWAVCRNVVPSPLLGDPCNWRALRRNIAHFVRLRRFEKFYLKQCMHQVKTSGFPFLSEFTSMCHLQKFKNEELVNEAGKVWDIFAVERSLHKKFVEIWIFWLFSCLIGPVLRANFYITETENGRHDVFYYRKVLWKKMMKKYIGTLQNEKFKLLDPTARASMPNEMLFCPKVRLLPKENGVRPLVSYKSSPIPISRFSLCNLNKVSNKEMVVFPKSGPHKVRLGSAKNGGNYLTSYNSQSISKNSPFPFPARADLRDLYVILKGIKMENPDLLGSSVFDYNDVYKKFYYFIASLKRESLSFPSVFIVACDVSKAFDSIDQEKLLSVMDDILYEEEYHLRKYVQVHCTKRSLMVHHNHLLADRGKCNYAVVASKRPSSSHSIIVDQASVRKIRREELLMFLSKHVRRNIWRLGGKLFLHEIGIPQGSMISSFLCSFYYGHLERKILFPLLKKCSVPLVSEYQRATKIDAVAGLFDVDQQNAISVDETNACQVKKRELFEEKIKKLPTSFVEGRFDCDSQVKFAASPNFLLLRLIDDFLFISSSMEQASIFFLRMYEGFKDYNCLMNNKKFCMNFDLPLFDGAFSKRTHMGDDGVTFVPWSGLLVNCHTLEVQADYTRYWGVPLSSTLTVWRSSKPGYHLKAKLCDYMRPKCHPLLYDSNINSPAVVRLNAYQAFLLCAMKFHCYVSSMPNGMCFSPTYYMEMIENSISYMYKLIKKRMHCFRSEKGLHPILQLKKEEVKWLGLSAYIRALKKKQSRHNELLVHLRSKVDTCSRGNTSRELRYAIEDSHSSVFWNIKY